jgi:HEAT repeat protein
MATLAKASSTPRPSPRILRLIAALDAEGEQGPRAAIAELAILGAPALESLLAATGSPRVRLRRWVLEALAPFSDRRVRPLLLAALGDANMTVRLHAIHALVARRDRRAATALAPLVRDSSGGIRVNAVMALATLGAHSAGPALITALADEKWYVRQQAAIAVGVLKISEASPTLARLLLKDPRQAVRAAAAEALAALGGKARKQAKRVAGR